MKQKKKNSAEKAYKLARKLLKEGDGLEMLRMHDFPDDESAHDDELTQRLYAEFSAELERIQTTLTEHFGEPAQVGNEDHDLIPLNGVFNFAIWEVNEQNLFVAAHHEDRGVPIILVIGIA